MPIDPNIEAELARIVSGTGFGAAAPSDAAPAVASSEKKWRKLIQNISDAVTVIDREGRVLESSGRFTDLLGYGLDEWVGRDGLAMIHPDDLDEARRLLRQAVEKPDEEVRVVLRTLTAAGTYADVEYTMVNLLADPDVAGLLLTSRNVTEQRRTEALVASEARVLKLIASDAPQVTTLRAIANMVQEHTPGHGGVFVVDRAERRLRPGALHDSHSPSDAGPLAESIGRLPLAWCEQRFCDERHAEGDQLAIVDLVSPDVHPVLAQHARELVDYGYRSVHAAPIIEPRTDVLLGIVTIHHGEPHEPSSHEREVASVASHLAAIAIERGRAREELEHQARHNPSTGLPNRIVIAEHVEAGLRRARNGERTVAVLFVDLDRFKVVNDSYGHAAGDELIACVAERLSEAVRPGDFLGHFGADEFVVIIEGVTGPEEAQVVARRVHLALDEPFALTDGEVYLSASVGIALADPSRDSEQTLMQHADAAMYRSKELGRARTEVFDHRMRRQALEHLRMDRDLRQAIERYEFVLHYQPKVDLVSGQVIGVESLLRWQHPERGLMGPNEFIGVAEDTGVVVRIGRWVIEEAVRQARRWADSLPGLPPFVISVNVSARQLADPELIATLQRTLHSYDWPAERLVLELTETILVDEHDARLAMLDRLKELGVKLAIDDFGTGYSSLSYLHRFPVDLIKIDRSFIVDLQRSGAGSPVAAAVVHVAKELELTTCAEGVEETWQLAGLRELRCDWAQGHLFSPPRPAHELEELLAAPASW